MTKSKGILAPRAHWQSDQVDVLRTRYPNESTEDIARDVGRTVGQVYQKAAALGLKKSPEYLSSPAACRLRHGDNVGIAHRFQKGGAAWNKGMVGLHIGGKDTQFKPGHRGGKAAEIYQPIGAERVSKDGYLQRKVNDDMPLQRRWRGVHLIIWEEVNGPLPSKHAIVFKDGNRTNTAIENLECISRADLMRRNTVHNLPKEITDLVRLRAVLSRHINKRSKS